MAKGKKRPPWVVFARGTALALGIYLMGTVVLALLAVRGTVPEAAVFPALSVLCLASALAGGLLCVRQSPWGRLPSGALAAGLFLAVLATAGLAGWAGLTVRGGLTAACGLAGGLLAGILGRKGRKPKRLDRRRTIAAKAGNK